MQLPWPPRDTWSSVGDLVRDPQLVQVALQS